MERDLVIGSRLANLEEIKNFLNEVFIETGIDMAFFNRVYLGLSEAVNNSILHGNCLCSDKSVFITVICDTNFLLLEVCDEGNGFDLNTISDPIIHENRKKENGRGIFLIRHFADDVLFLEGGRRVRIKYILNE